MNTMFGARMAALAVPDRLRAGTRLLAQIFMTIRFLTSKLEMTPFFIKRMLTAVMPPLFHLRRPVPASAVVPIPWSVRTGSCASTMIPRLASGLVNRKSIQHTGRDRLHLDWHAIADAYVLTVVAGKWHRSIIYQIYGISRCNHCQKATSESKLIRPLTALNQPLLLVIH